MLATRRHGERALLLHVLTRSMAATPGWCATGRAPRQRGTYVIGNRLDLTWRARLAEHLGTFRAELEESHAARFIDDGAASRRARLGGRAGRCDAARAASRIRAPIAASSI